MGIGPRAGVLLRAHLGPAIVTNGDFTAYVCDSASTVGAAVWGGACGGPRHCCITCGSTLCNGKGSFFGGLFPIFTIGNAITSATVKCFRVVYENLTTFPFGKHIVGKLDSWACGQYIHFQDQRRGLREISKNVTLVRLHAASCSGVYFRTVLPDAAIITLDTASRRLAEAGDAQNFPR